MISDKFGSVCLLENATSTGMETYRLGPNTWNAIATNKNEPTQSDVINEVKNTEGALQDAVYDDAEVWMDAFFCSKNDDGSFVCSAF